MTSAKKKNAELKKETLTRKLPEIVATIKATVAPAGAEYDDHDDHVNQFRNLAALRGYLRVQSHWATVTCRSLVAPFQNRPVSILK